VQDATEDPAGSADHVLLRPLARLTEAVASARHLGSIYDASLTALEETLGITRSSILLFDPDRVLRFKAWRGLSDGYRAAVEGHTPWSPETKDAQPVLVTDVMGEESLGELRSTIKAEGIGALAFIPLNAHRRLLGKFMLYKDAPYAFSENDLLVAQLIASQVAFAIDQRRTMERLALYREIFDKSNDGIAVIDTQGRYVEQNPSHATLIGYSDAELAGETPAIHLGNETFFVIAAELAKNGSFRGDVTSETRDGRTLTLDLSAFSVADSRGDVLYHVGIKRDISDRKRMEEAALHLSAIVESSDDAIASKTLEGIVVSWNPGAERIFGYTASEIIGRSIRTIIPQDRQQEEDEVLRRISQGERVDHYETIRRRKDGTEVPISLTVSPVRDANNRIIGASKIARDITDQKAAEEALRRSIAIRDEFVSLVSHELRTPLSAILGNSRLLLKSGERLAPQDRQQALLDIASEAERLNDNIEHLLLFSRLKSIELEFEPVSLPALVMQCIDTSKQRDPDREVIVHKNADIPPVLGQETLTSLVMQNLLTNAAKYSAADAPIEVFLDFDEAGNVEVRVRDYGIGLDQHDIENLFTPFYRSDKARNKASGFGLGLAVCKQALEAQNGSIGAVGRPDGADFYFTLPPADESNPD
jgi:PAS domain S-box-containing protein